MASEDEDLDPKVTYAVRDLLDQLRRDLGREIGDMRRTVNDKLDLLFTRLDSKADKADVTALESKVGSMDDRLHTVEALQATVKHHADQQREQRRWLWPLLLSLGVLIVMALGVYFQYKAVHH